MLDVLPQHQMYLRDAFGSPITEGCCVVDDDHQVGYVRLDLGPHLVGPASAQWDGWFNVTSTRSGDPLARQGLEGRTRPCRERRPAMTWHTEVVDAKHFQVLLGTIRSTGGTVTHSCPCQAGYSVTYVTVDA